MEKLGLNFGQLIAYLIPGFLAVYALADFVPQFAALLGRDGIPQAEALVPLLVLGLAVGVVVNAFSWALLRPLFALSGVKRPDDLTYTKLRKDDIAVYNTIVEANFRYHQFYSNMLIAVLVYAPTWLAAPATDNLLRNGSFLAVVGVLFLAARDSLSRAYVRMLALLSKEGKSMTNGDPKWKDLKSRVPQVQDKQSPVVLDQQPSPQQQPGKAQKESEPQQPGGQKKDEA